MGRRTRFSFCAFSLSAVCALALTSAASGADDPPPDLKVSYKLGSTFAPPGTEAVIPFTMRATGDIRGYAVSVDFDENVLEGLQVEQVWAKPDGSEYAFRVYVINNRTDIPGSDGTDEGFLIGVALFDTFEPVVLPADTDNLALRFHFRVKPDATVTATEVKFLDGGKGEGQPVRNSVTAYHRMYTPEVAIAFVMLGGSVAILDDITVFFRGDSNGDRVLDISDPQRTLGFLFLGDAPPPCLDAADFNDDGALDITDPIATLGFLFLDGTPPPAPYPAPGHDGTEDLLSCGPRA